MPKPLRVFVGIAMATAGAAGLVLVLSRFGVVYLGGWSMAPSYVPGDLMLYRKPPCRPTQGDAVLVAASDSTRPFIHRVVGVEADGCLRTRGDANVSVDVGRAFPEDVAGVVIGAVPSGRATHALVSGIRWCYNRLPIANTRR